MDDDPMDEGTGPPVVHSEFATADHDRGEEYLSAVYTEVDLRLPGDPAAFRLSHTVTAGPGFTLMRHQTTAMTLSCEQMPDVLIMVEPVSGRYSYLDSNYPDLHAQPGQMVLAPPDGPTRAVCEQIDTRLINLERDRVADYATAMTGLDPDHLRFDDLHPLSAALAEHLSSTVARVRDHVLTDPWVAAQPIVLDQTFQSLAAALLSTFPNTALARATDPEAPPVRGAVPSAKLREVLDYLDAHADQPIGPADITELTGLPVSEIVEGLRRRRGVHPAQLLWAARLRGVRRDLLDADPHTSVPVAQIAARWGFTRPARFRVAYQRAFDETPEHTLRR